MIGNTRESHEMCVHFQTYFTFSPNRVCPHGGVLTVGAKGPGLDQDAPFGLPLVPCKLSHKSALVRCPCAFRLCRLAQDVGLSFGFSEGIVLLARPARFLRSLHGLVQILVGRSCEDPAAIPQ